METRIKTDFLPIAGALVAKTDISALSQELRHAHLERLAVLMENFQLAIFARIQIMKAQQGMFHDRTLRVRFCAAP